MSGSCSCDGKAVTRNGVRVGIIEGILTSATPDCGGKAGVPDVIVRGAFARSVSERRRQGRPVPLLDSHDPTQPVGLIPVESIVEDADGLHVRAEVNLETPRGRELHALARQGALAFSVGFQTIRDEVLPDRRLVLEAELLEGSLVSAGCNPDARILAVKGAGLAQILEDLKAITAACRAERRMYERLEVATWKLRRAEEVK